MMKPMPSFVTSLLRLAGAGLLAFALWQPVFAQQATPAVETVRPIPPPGVALPEETHARLTTEAARLGDALRERERLWTGPDTATRLASLPDVEIFWKAVDWALRYDEFYDVKQAVWAEAQVREGWARLAALDRDERPWLTQTGLVVRGYRSRIDDSVQPFGLVVPPSFKPDLPYRWRLDGWFHGRGEKLTELDFIHQRQTQPGEFTPQDTIVLHPYGRYCNGHRFAGETDFFEALAVVQRDYRIDEDRILVRGFSLGGAACWHLATHHPWRWCAAAPGAGFSETEAYLNFFKNDPVPPTWWERKMWTLYDSTVVAGNLLAVPTVAYSGELDKQKQAADMMAAALAEEGVSLTHLIGPQTAHKYEPGAKAELNRRMDLLARRGRQIHDQGNYFLDTFSLRTNHFGGGTIDGLAEHWKKSKIRMWSPFPEVWRVELENVTAFTIDLPSGCLERIFDEFPDVPPSVSLGDFAQSGPGNSQPTTTNFPEKPLASDGSYRASFHFADGVWKAGPFPEDVLRKKPGLQGPIDDAFMEPFLFVRPTGTATHDAVGAWAAAELARAVAQWRSQFRGDARVKDDVDVTAEDIAQRHLVLWGDPASNAVLAKLANHLPIAWTSGELTAGDRVFSAATHALIAIYPNPLNPEKYVVLNSGFTFREAHYLSNSRQTPKLPDWAVIDLTTPPGPRTPGRVAAADFFDERWQLKPPPPEGP